MKHCIWLIFWLLGCSILPAQVQVKFTVSDMSPVPRDSIYISGSFNDWHSTANPAYRLMPSGFGEHSITLNLEAGPIQYKYHGGSWDKVEMYYPGYDQPEREIIVSKDTALVTRIRAWKDQPDRPLPRLDIAPDMFESRYKQIYLGEINAWVFKTGHDPAWATPGWDVSDWEKLKPNDISANYADKNGRLEGWFRAKIKLDTAFVNLPVWLLYFSWAAADIYIDGQLFHRYGNTNLSGPDFREYNSVHQIPIPFHIQAGKEHVIAIHFVDYTSPLPPFGLKRRMSINITTPERAAVIAEHINQEPIFVTLWFVVGLLFCLLFWLLAFQNPSEKNLRLIALCSTAMTLLSYCTWTPHNPNVSFVFLKINENFLKPFVNAVVLILIPLVIIRIFNRRIPRLLLFFYIVFLLAGAASTVLFREIGDLVLYYSFTSNAVVFSLCVYYILSSWKTLRGAQWAIVGGILVSMTWIVLFYISTVIYGFLETNTVSLYDTGMFLSLPLSLLVYVAMRFKEIIGAVQENARQVLQLSEEKREQALQQQKVLEEEVSRQTIELRKSFDDLQTAQTQIVAQKERAESSEAFKSRFLANMSHEIRTPLHGIAGFTDLLLDTSLSEKQRRWLSSIQHSTDRLGEVVNDILDLSKLEAGEVSLRHIPFSPARIAGDVQEALSVRAENKGIELRLDIAETIPAAVSGDPTRLYQILMNLVSNAVKFTERGSVTLSLRGGATPENGPSIVFVVTDTGIGIPPERLASVFDSFQQASEDTTARFGGTGLGLTIARELVQLHGSDIRVESKVDQGSTFSFALALPPAEAADLAVESARNEALYFTQPLRILLADDSALNREIAIEAIRRHFEHADIVEAATGQEVVEIVTAALASSQNLPELVLMDMQMPEMTGLEATRYIREHLSADLPIIALTASTTPEEIETALASGMNRHLGKPFKPHELARAIAGTLHLQTVPVGLPPEPAPSPATSAMEVAAAFDMTFLRDFTNGDEIQMQYFLQKFMERYPVEIKNLEAAVIAVDREAIFQVAHSFRPQLEFVGLQEATNLILQLEQGARVGQASEELAALLMQIKAILQSLPVFHATASGSMATTAGMDA